MPFWGFGLLLCCCCMQTMLQRTSTNIVRSETLMDLGLGDLYSERAIAAGIDHHTADLIFASIPYGLLPDFQKPVYAKIKEKDADLYEGQIRRQHSATIGTMAAAMTTAPAVLWPPQGSRRSAFCTTGVTTSRACS